MSNKRKKSENINKYFPDTPIFLNLFVGRQFLELHPKWVFQMLWTKVQRDIVGFTSKK